MPPMHFVALCGSLRAQSVNAALLDAVVRLAPAPITVTRFTQIGDLPLFNPDTEYPSPVPVQALIDTLCAADGVLIASPEYAHGVTGVIKNALDWTVGSEAFVNKPVAVLNASPRATHADAALRETLAVMNAQVVEAASATLPVMGRKLDADGIVADAELGEAIVDALRALQAHVEQSEKAT